MRGVAGTEQDGATTLEETKRNMEEKTGTKRPRMFMNGYSSYFRCV